MAKKMKNTKLFTLLGALVVVLLIAGVFWAMSVQQTRMGDAPLVSVNGEVIFESEVFDLYNRLPPEMRSQYGPEVILDQLIEQRLILQYAKQQGVTITDEQLEQAVDERLSFFGTTRQELADILEAQGDSYAEFERGVYHELVLDVFVSTVLLPRVRVTDSQVHAYYEDNIHEFRAQPGQVRIRHILVSSEELASEIRQQAVSGTEFTTLAMVHSIDSAPRGGDLGFISEESPLVEPFKSVALALEVNEVSQPVQTQFGWHVIRRESDEIPLREAREVIQQQLREQAAQQEFRTLLNDLRSSATIRHHKSLED